MKPFSLIILFILFLPCLIFPFGKNKITYETYQWRVLETDHFRIYVPEPLLNYSNRVTALSEEIYAHHTNRFQQSVQSKIKVLIYPNSIDFQQNNIMPTDSGTGGFTEFVKGRVTIPFSASDSDFEHVLSHELNHAFQGYIWGKGNISIFAIRDIDIPLWMIEGASEYNSIGLDPETEMILADAVINGKLPTLMELSDLYFLPPEDYYFIYKEGQAFYEWINRKFGPNIYARLNRSIADDRNFETVLKKVFSKNLQELNGMFMDDLRKRYMPDINKLDDPEVTSVRLLQKDTRFNFNPVELSLSNIVFISDRGLYPALVSYNLSNDELKQMVKGGFNEEYLDFPFGKQNQLSVSSNGMICFVSRSGESDVIHLYNTNTGRTLPLETPFRTITAPDIKGDGSLVVFAAVSNGLSDIYLYSISSKAITRLTDDGSYNNQPRFLGTNRIVYVSNRRLGKKSTNYDLVFYNLDEKRITGFLDSGASDEYPAVSFDGNKIAFIKMGVHPSLNILNLEKNEVFEELVPTGGIFTPSFTSDNRILFTAYHQAVYNVYQYTPRYTNKTKVTPVWNEFPYRATTDIFLSPKRITKYSPEFSIDNVLFGFMLNSSAGFSGLGLLTWSDLLGDEKYQLLMNAALAFNTDFWNALNMDLSYDNSRYRFNFGYHLFRYNNYFYELSSLKNFIDMEKTYQSSYGGEASVSYPFTTFDRVETTLSYRKTTFIDNAWQVDTNWYFTLSTVSKPSISAAFVHDSTLEDSTGPVDGMRYELAYEKLIPVFNDSLNADRLTADFRNYWTIFPGYSVAFRAVAGKVIETGNTSYPFYLGGFNSIRGYELWTFSGDTILLANLELRVPFIYGSKMGFPLPIQLPTVWGALFWDFGSVWNWNDGYHPLTDSTNDVHFRDLKSGLGFGFRIVLLPGIKLMLDIATPFTGESLPDLSLWQNFWQIGVDF